jgi:hypothetical protein
MLNKIGAKPYGHPIEQEEFFIHATFLFSIITLQEVFTRGL